MSGEWLVGEERICAGLQTLEDKKHPKEMAKLFCPKETENNNPHNVSVVFWGKLSRPDADIFDEVSATKGAWRCTRKSDLFVCKAMN
jgi:hypothetical protein